MPDNKRRAAGGNADVILNLELDLAYHKRKEEQWRRRALSAENALVFNVAKAGGELVTLRQAHRAHRGWS